MTKWICEVNYLSPVLYMYTLCRRWAFYLHGLQAFLTNLISSLKIFPIFAVWRPPGIENYLAVGVFNFREGGSDTRGLCTPPYSQARLFKLLCQYPLFWESRKFTFSRFFGGNEAIYKFIPLCFYSLFMASQTLTHVWMMKKGKLPLKWDKIGA